MIFCTFGIIVFLCVFIFVLRLQWAKKLGWLFLAVGGRSSMREWQLTATLRDLRRHCVPNLNWTELKRTRAFPLETTQLKNMHYPSKNLIAILLETKLSLCNLQPWWDLRRTRLWQIKKGCLPSALRFVYQIVLVWLPQDFTYPKTIVI